MAALLRARAFLGGKHHADRILIVVDFMILAGACGGGKAMAASRSSAPEGTVAATGAASASGGPVIVATVAVGSYPYGVAVNRNSNRIYVTS